MIRQLELSKFWGRAATGRTMAAPARVDLDHLKIPNFKFGRASLLVTQRLVTAAGENPILNSFQPHAFTFFYMGVRVSRYGGTGSGAHDVE